MIYTHFVKTGRFTLQQAVAWMSEKPAEIFGLKAGRLMVGAPADLAIFDLETAYTVDSDQFLSKGKTHHLITGHYMGIPPIHWSMEN